MFFSDILLVALLMKLLCETASTKLLPWPYFAASFIALPFLLGAGGRYGNRVLREGMGIAGIILFIFINTAARWFYPFYLTMIIIGLLLYVMGRLARRTLRSLIIAALVITAVTYLIFTDAS
mgnify:CR=1 FL=1